MSALTPISSREVRTISPGGGSRLQRRAATAMEALECNTMLRIANVAAEALVQSEKLHEVDRLASVAMGGQAWLNLAVSTLSRNDPLAADDYRYFADMAKLAKTEILMDAVNRIQRV